MQTKFILPCLLSTLFFLNSFSPSAQNRKTIETTTDILMSFIQRRYGWKFGLPAYLLSAYVGWGRTYAKKHDWWAIIGGAAIGTASSYIFTRPFARKHNITFSPVILSGQHPGFYASIRF